MACDVDVHVNDVYASDVDFNVDIDYVFVDFVYDVDVGYLFILAMKLL